MFTNKAHAWKLGGALALVAALGMYCAREGESINPALWRCLAEPQRWDNTYLWMSEVKVVSVAEGEFVVQRESAQIPVRGEASVAPGERVGVTGTFRAAGTPHLVLKEIRKLPSTPVSRRVPEAVSVIVFLLVLANFLRRFRFLPGALRGEERGNP